MTFPDDFLWGTAAASYQIEGGGLADGRGECIWHRFSHTPGKIKNGDTGDVACDHYRRYRGDVGLMRELGLGAYRFSIAWARVLPKGTGATNPPGLDFYDRLVDELLKVGIRPFVTLYHWDLPQALQDRGGWDNPDCVAWFTEYTDLMTRRLGDRVKDWITFNEPWCTAFLGYGYGVHAPGITDMRMAYRAAHHVLLAHGAAVPVIRRNIPDARAGITIDLGYFEAATPDKADAEAAWREDGQKNRWFLDAVFKGRYPEDMVRWRGDFLKGIDLDAVKQAAVLIDFLGINYYTRSLIAHDESSYDSLKTRQVIPASLPRTAMGWEVYPQGLTRLLTRVHQEYAPKAIYITENGAAFDDPEPKDGLVDDPQRVAYLEGHFRAAHDAIEQGVPLKGYFVWSLMDNFEWAEGYDKRFGIIHVDFQTQQRIPKSSARFVQHMVKR